jgi:hypothetical protein
LAAFAGGAALAGAGACANAGALAMAIAATAERNKALMHPRFISFSPNRCDDDDEFESSKAHRALLAQPAFA